MASDTMDELDYILQHAASIGIFPKRDEKQEQILSQFVHMNEHK